MLHIIGLITAWAFRLSFIYYALWLGLGAYSAIKGIDSGSSPPAPKNSKDNKEYGWKGFTCGLALGYIITANVGWPVPLYQAVYIVVRIVMYIVG